MKTWLRVHLSYVGHTRKNKTKKKKFRCICFIIECRDLVGMWLALWRINIRYLMMNIIFYIEYIYLCDVRFSYAMLLNDFSHAHVLELQLLVARSIRYAISHSNCISIYLFIFVSDFICFCFDFFFFLLGFDPIESMAQIQINQNSNAGVRSFFLSLKALIYFAIFEEILLLLFNIIIVYSLLIP